VPGCGFGFGLQEGQVVRGDDAGHGVVRRVVPDNLVRRGVWVEVMGDALQHLVVLVVDGGGPGQSLVDVVTDRGGGHGGLCVPAGREVVFGVGGVVGRAAAEPVEFVGELVDLGLEPGGESFGLALFLLGTLEFLLGALFLFLSAGELLLSLPQGVGGGVFGAELVAFAGQTRCDHNRLGFALQMCTVRCLGLLLEDPLDVLWSEVAYVAEHLGVEDPSVVKRYTERQMAAYEHAWKSAAASRSARGGPGRRPARAAP
jgi:hypothetical protein